jgi:hypothetical protein
LIAQQASAKGSSAATQSLVFIGASGSGWAAGRIHRRGSFRYLIAGAGHKPLPGRFGQRRIAQWLKNTLLSLFTD